MGDYWVLRDYARWEFKSQFAVTLRGENLTDQHYETTIGFPALRTTLFCGAEIRFKCNILSIARIGHRNGISLSAWSKSACTIECLA
jgi:hypothetical protein